MSGPAKRKALEAGVDVEDAVENKRQKLSETADTTEDSQSQGTGENHGDVEDARQALGTSSAAAKDPQEEKTNETDGDAEDERLEAINAAAPAKEPTQENSRGAGGETERQRASDPTPNEGCDADRNSSEQPPNLCEVEKTTKEAASKKPEVVRSDISDKPGPARKPSDPHQCSCFPYSPPPTRITEIFRAFEQEIADITRARYAYCDPTLVHLRPRESYLDTAEDRRIAGLTESVKSDVQELELRMLKAKDIIELKDKTKAEEMEVGRRLRDILGPRGETYARLKANVDCEVKMLHARLKTLHRHLSLDKIQDYWYSTYRPVEQ